MKSYIKIMRPWQWVKNLLIFFPIIFHGSLCDGDKLEMTMGAFVVFSFTASAIYIINDIADVEKDRLHPTKCKRPIAAGLVPLRSAKILAVLLFVISFALCILWYKSIAMIGILFTYLFLNIGYSLWKWKNMPILDLCILAGGFLLRLLFGACATAVPVSAWLYLVTLSGAFFCGFGKRRNELIHNSDKSREVLGIYSEKFLESNMYVCMALMIIFFAFWCLEKEYELLIPFVMILCFRYSYDVENNVGDGDPSNIILHDKVLLGIGAVFAIAVLGMIYYL